MNSIYQKVTLKSHAQGKNEGSIPNHLARQFNQLSILEAVITNLTYVRVSKRLADVCLIIVLFNCEIIYLSVSWHKTAELVKQASQTIPSALTKVKLFHSDIGEVKNSIII